MRLSFLFLFLLLLIVVLVDIPPSLCADDPRYTNCSRMFLCGSTGVNYPFWGGGRADYCGRSGFEIKCGQNNTAQIQIMTETYKVLRINRDEQILRISRIDLLDDVCPSRYEMGALNFNLFDYALGVVNLTLLYRCPPLPPNETTSSPFNCDINGTISPVYIDLSEFIPSTLGPQNQRTCNIIVKVPVLQIAAAQSLSDKLSSLPNLPGVLKKGFDVKYFAGDVDRCKQCTDSDGRCGRNSASGSFTCFCRDGPHETICVGGGSNKLNIGAAVGGVLGGTFITVGMIFLCWMRRKYSSYNSVAFWKKETKNAKNVEAFLKSHGALAPKRYRYSDVKKMTNLFKDKLGQGGYGGVFKGELLDGRMVAVKVLSETKGNGEEFINEVASICRTSHVNIVSLLGFCVEGPKRALIYEFMPNGSLEKFIYNARQVDTQPHLGWETLYKIAIGIAQGLEYLHRGCNTRILHFDIKPHNILLDKDFCPKISDFGLAKLCLVNESIISMTGARGTPGYIAPELVSRNFGGVSHKSDVYSYGMMLLEMVGRRKNINTAANTSEIYFPHWIYNRLDMSGDLGLHGVTSMEDEEITRKMIIVGLWCIQIDPSNRPPMSKVLDMLEGNLEALQVPPKPFFSSPSREQEHSSTSYITANIR